MWRRDYSSAVTTDDECRPRGSPGTELYSEKAVTNFVTAL